MKPIIELQNVKKIYQMGAVKVPALNGVSLEIPNHKFVTIIGPSGSGKSTMMNLVGALDIPTHGKILLDGNDISEMSESELAQLRGKKIGFVFQQFNLITTLTAKENVMLPMIFQNVLEEDRESHAEELLDLVDLGDRMHHRPNELSGGQQQRVAIARSLANNPDMILADEPTGNLDTKTGQQIMNLLNTLNKKEGKTIVMVTHDTDLVKHADIIVKLKDGVIDTLKKNNH